MLAKRWKKKERGSAGAAARGNLQCGPPDPDDVSVEEVLELWEDVSQEERVHSGSSCVKGRHGTERNWVVGEVGGVEINAEKLVNACQSGRRSSHSVVSRRQSVQVFVPWWRAGEEELNSNANQIQVSETDGVNRERAWWGKYEDNGRCEEWEHKVTNSVWEPSEQVEECVGMCGKNVTEVGAIDDVLQSWQDTNPNWWSPR
jgi:hypothetical protein